MSVNDIGKLPKWAQQRIETADRNAAYWRAQAESGPEASDTFVHAYTDDGRRGGQPLGIGTDIRFNLSDDEYLVAHLERGALQIHAGSRLGNGLVVRPQSSNTLRIEVAP